MSTEISEENAKILLDVADEIEKDPDYDGYTFWDNETKKGCAMTRILQHRNAKVIEQDDSGVVFSITDFENNRIFSTFEIGNILATLIGFSENFWYKEIFDLSVNPDKDLMVKVLRMLGNKTYNFSNSLPSNLRCE